jgi:uncharacterized protein
MVLRFGRSVHGPIIAATEAGPGRLPRLIMHYLLFYELVPDYVNRRAPLRAEHLRLAWASHARGEMVLGGILTDPVDRAVLMFQGDSPDVARRFAETDPYVLNGLVTRWDVRQWVTVAGEHPATPVRPEDLT